MYEDQIAMSETLSKITKYVYEHFRPKDDPEESQTQYDYMQ